MNKSDKYDKICKIVEKGYLNQEDKFREILDVIYE